MAQSGPNISKTVDTSSEYVLLSAVISSDRTEYSTEISSLVSEFVIHEHIEKPYLTMLFQFLDDANIVQTIDLQGGEKLTIKLKQTEEIDRGIEIVKEFVIDKITSAIKADERSEIVVLSLNHIAAATGFKLGIITFMSLTESTPSITTFLFV